MKYSRSMPRMSRRHFVQMSAAATIPSFPIFDSHVHVWEHQTRFPFAAGAKVPAEDAGPEMLLRLMGQNGIEKTVIIQVIHYRFDNPTLPMCSVVIRRSSSESA